MNYRALFAISIMVSLVSMVSILILSPELAANLVKLSVIPDELDPETLESAKEILKKCNLSPGEFDRINEVLFAAEKELDLNNDPVEAERIFKTVRGDLISCKLRPDGGPSFIDTIIGRTVQIIGIAGGLSTIIFGYLGYRKLGKKFL